MVSWVWGILADQKMTTLTEPAVSLPDFVNSVLWIDVASAINEQNWSSPCPCVRVVTGWVGINVSDIIFDSILQQNLITDIITLYTTYSFFTWTVLRWSDKYCCGIWSKVKRCDHAKLNRVPLINTIIERDATSRNWMDHVTNELNFWQTSKVKYKSLCLARWCWNVIVADWIK